MVAPGEEGRVTAEASLLLVLLLVGHFLGDFTPLSTARMLRAKAIGRPLRPIFEHAGVHAGLVAMAVGIMGVSLRGIVLAAAVELLTHFAIDVGRGRLMHRFPRLSDPADGAFWTTLGLDQLAHGLVLLGLVRLVL